MSNCYAQGYVYDGRIVEKQDLYFPICRMGIFDGF